MHGIPRIGALPSGARDLISDVAGVTVGHVTLADGAIQTGVSVVLPHQRDPFLYKAPAAATVINGFGKSARLIQVRELGVLETPIALTNTFAVGAVASAQIRQAIGRHREIGRAWPTLNPLVFECNDGYLNDIQVASVTEQHYAQACASATASFEQGCVGAGRGMSCFGLKGGIGSASRLAVLRDGRRYGCGALVLANFGRLENLCVAGKPLGQWLSTHHASAGSGHAEPDKGSIITIIATDAPLDARQITRLAKRAAVALARMGSAYGHGSGDIALAFSTAYQIPHHAHEAMPALAMLHESHMDALFEACAQAVEQAIVHALWHAVSVTGRDGHRRLALVDALPQWPMLLNGK
ncbi:MAG: P1 family peptidase [Burkholderiaceae bacterium]|jgi:D-aminopeptidase|nr:P1 family peptidase [Burkholderiaceae bacterium]